MHHAAHIYVYVYIYIYICVYLLVLVDIPLINDRVLVRYVDLSRSYSLQDNVRMV